MNDNEKEELENIVENLDRDVKLPPYDQDSSRGYSREYLEYKEEESQEAEMSRYEKFCYWSANFIRMKASEGMRKSLMPSIRLVDLEISPSMVVSASLISGAASLIGWLFIFFLNSLLGSFIPTEIMLITAVVPFGVGLYVYYYPKLEAQNKIIESSGDMIMSILYMVVYMRSSPNLEGAVRFAALNLQGPIAKDLKKVLWNVEVGEYSSVEESLHEYTKVWKDFNDDFLQSLQLIEAAMNDSDADRRERMLQDSIDTILDGTSERMKHYAQSLKTPVMILNALGAMLPVMGMIMLPIISVFMGASITAMHLISFYNVILPVALYWFMKRVLNSRPPTTSSRPISKADMPSRNRLHLSLLGKNFSFPSWIVGLFIFVIVAFYGVTGYLAFPHTFPAGNATPVESAPSMYAGDNGLNPIPMLLRSLSITYGLGLAIGVSLVIGNKKRKKKEEEIDHIERQFAGALFQLGNQVAGGTPVELALDDAANSTKEMEISGLFRKASDNIRNLGMTFKQSLFDQTHGALREYPSQLIHTVMKAVMESSEKGSQMASMAMMTISRYLQDIHKTQENLNDLLEETTSTITMLAYLLAPVVSGIAVGMSQTIISAMVKIYGSYTDSGFEGAGTGSGGLGGSSILGNLDTTISPEILQMVVGIYLIQLLFILGSFYVKITKGNDVTSRNLLVGKLLIMGCTLYSIVLVIVGVVFGNLVTSVAV